jgi:hypothetical protein
MAETLADLQKQKEDIKILLSTLEDAFREASITEEHYNEVKGKNQKKLEELEKKIQAMESKEAKKAEKKAARAKKETKKKPKEAKPEPPPASPPNTPPPPATTPAQPATPAPSEPQPEGTDYSSIPQPLTDVAGAVEAEEAKPEKAPGAVKTGEPGTLRYTAGEIREMFTKILKEIKPQGIEVLPRVDKLEVQLEKVRAYLDSMKDERSSGKEGTQRLTEEVGEMRSNVSNIDRRLSESEIKVSEVSESLGDLRPQKFLKIMREEDATIKMHEARLDKLDDLSSAMLKKLGQIEEVLKKLGSLEKIVNFSREAAKRLLEIENREKRISRIADKIDGIFMELNKRLDEFVLYKAKQDTLDELSQEMMKSLDEMNTKIQKYAEKSDLDMLKDTITTELTSIKTQAGTSPAVQKLEAQKTEIEGLISMLDEQFKSGALPEKDYKKTKQINSQRLEDIKKKIAEAQSGGTPAQSPQDWAKQQFIKPGGPEEAAAPGAKPGEASKQPASVPVEPAEKPPGTQPAKKEPAEKPDKSEKNEPLPQESAERPAESTKKEATPQEPVTKKAQPEAKEKPKDRQEGLMSQLEDSLMKGLIGRKAFEKTKKLIKGGKK